MLQLIFQINFVNFHNVLVCLVSSLHEFLDFFLDDYCHMMACEMLCIGLP